MRKVYVPKYQCPDCRHAQLFDQQGFDEAVQNDDWTCPTCGTGMVGEHYLDTPTVRLPLRTA